MMKHQAAIAGILLMLMLFCLQSVNAAHCNDIAVDAEDVTLVGNSTDYFYFPIYNESDQDFDVYEVAASKKYASSPFTVTATDYPAEIEADSAGEITIRVKAEGVTQEETGLAYVKVRGYFDDGEYCDFGEIGKAYFDVTVEEDGEEEEAGDCDEIELHAHSIHIDEGKRGTYTFTIENQGNADFELYGIEMEEDSSYFDAELYSKPSTVKDGEDRDFKVKITAKRVSSDKQGKVELRARGRFEEGEYCSYDEIDEEEFTVYVENTGTGDGDGDDDYDDDEETECEDIALNSHTVRVGRGNTAYTTFYLENYAEEKFLVDYVSVFDNSGDFKAEENGYEREVKARDVAFVNVKVRAYDDAEIGREDAYVEVKGRFQGGEACYLNGVGLEAFPVVIEESAAESNGNGAADFAPTGCGAFSLIVPAAQEIGRAGTVPITIDNRTGSRATVRLQGAGLNVVPALISVPKFTTLEERVRVESKLAESTLVYGIEAAGCTAEKRTAITAEGVQEKEEPATPTEQFVEAIATGFAVLGENMAAVGLVVVIVLLLYLVLKR